MTRRVVWLTLLVIPMFLPLSAYGQSAMPWVFHSGATATGNGNVLQAEYFSTVIVQIEGTFVGTVVFEKKSKDGTSFFLVQCRNSETGELSTAATDPGYWECPGGAYSFRARVSAYISGTIVVTGGGTTATAAAGGGGSSQGLGNVIAVDRTYGGAVSQATAPRFGSSITGRYWLSYDDPTNGLQWVCEVAGVPNDCHYVRTLAETKYWGIKDDDGNLVFQIFPSAATMKARYPFSANYYPLKSVWVGAGSLYGDGTQCPERPTAVTINSGPKIPTFICAEHNSARLVGMVPMPDNWDASTILIKPYYIQTAADTGSVALEVAAACRGMGETFNGTYGAELNVTDAAVTGSNAIDSTTSAAVTANGTCTAGDMLYFYIDVDGTANPTTAAATLHYLGAKIYFGVTSLSE